jgi:hypothetical protein
MRAYHTEEVVNGGATMPGTTQLSDAVLRQAENLLELERDVEKVSVTVDESHTGGISPTEKPMGMLQRLFAPSQNNSPQILSQPSVVEYSTDGTTVQEAGAPNTAPSTDIDKIVDSLEITMEPEENV